MAIIDTRNRMLRSQKEKDGRNARSKIYVASHRNKINFVGHLGPLLLRSLVNFLSNLWFIDTNSL